MTDSAYRFFAEVAELRRKNAIYRKQIREMQAALRVANLVMQSQAQQLVIRRERHGDASGVVLNPTTEAANAR